MRNIVLKRLLQSSSSFTRSPSSRSNPFLLSSRCVSLFLSLILSMYIYVFECLCMDALDELFFFSFDAGNVVFPCSSRWQFLFIYFLVLVQDFMWGAETVHVWWFFLWFGWLSLVFRLWMWQTELYLTIINFSWMMRVTFLEMWVQGVVIWIEIRIIILWLD